MRLLTTLVCALCAVTFLPAQGSPGQQGSSEEKGSAQAERAATAEKLDDAPIVDADSTGTIEQDEDGQTKIKLPGMRSLTIGGQYRLRYENHYNFDFDSDVSDPRDYFTQRIRLDFGFEFNDQVSGLFQFQDVRVWGEETSTIDGSADAFDVHQGYVDIADFPGISGTARIGRQRLSYGAQRLVGGLEWLSRARSFDGFRHRWSEADSYDVDLFATVTHEDITSTVIHDDAYFLGAYSTFDIADDGIVDAYLLFLNNDETLAGGTEHRLTLGGRYVQRFDSVEVGAEVATQTGELDDADIPIGKTFAVEAHVELSFEGDLKPFVRGEVNVASGDDPNTSDDERFDVLFPTGHAHWGMMDLATWENLINGMLRVGIATSERGKATISWNYFESFEETDVFGGPSGVLSTGGVGFSNSMGNEIDLYYHLDFDTDPLKSSLELGYGIFLPGQGVEDAKGSDDPAQFLYVQGDFRF